MGIDVAPVLVTGATGKQGGAVVRAMARAGLRARALVRDASSQPARNLESLGVDLVVGDLHDRASLLPAVEGARAVFSVQMPSMSADGVDFDGEVAQGANLVAAAKAAGVSQFVHSSVTGAGQHVETPGWDEGRWTSMEPTLSAKTAVQDAVREAGFAHWTILKPGFFMENFLPSAAFLFPRGLAGGIVTMVKPRTRLSLVAVDDIGAATVKALTQPERFHRLELELASDHLSMAEVADVLSRTLGVRVEAPDMTEDEALAAGMPAMAAAHDWLNAMPQPARPQHARALGIPLTSFEIWAERNMPRTSSAEWGYDTPG